MLRVRRLLPLLLLPLTAAADPPAEQDPELILPPSQLEATLLQLGEIQQRLTVPIGVGASGPFNFVIDTGAERTVVSRELARSLALQPAAPVTIISMASRMLVDTVRVPALSIKSINERHDVIAPALRARHLGATGLLGIDALQKHRVTIDFTRNVMAVTPSTKRKLARDPDEIVIRAKNIYGQLIITQAYYGSTRIQVVIDTGSEVTVGNTALRKKLGSKVGKSTPIQLTSATGQEMSADYAMVDGLRIASAKFSPMPVAFSDVLPFERFGLTNHPALLLGMDVLRSFRRVDIDFPNREIRLLLPKGTPEDRGFNRDFWTNSVRN